MSQPIDIDAPDIEAALRDEFREPLAVGLASIRVYRNPETVDRIVDEMLVDGYYHGEGVTLTHDRHRGVVVEVYEG